MSVLFAYLRIVPGSDIIASVLIGNAHEFTPFDMTVAQDTGVRRTTGHVFVNEVLDDAALEGISEIDYMMLKSHLLGVMLRFHDGLDGAAAFLFGETGLLDAVKSTEGDSHNLVALLQEEHGADGGVNATGHAEQNLHNVEFRIYNSQRALGVWNKFVRYVLSFKSVQNHSNALIIDNC